MTLSETATAAKPTDEGFSTSICGFTAAMGPDGRVYLSGELDITGLDALRAALDQALVGPGDWLIVDISGMSFIDSSAISELLRYQIAAAGLRRTMCLVGATEHVSTVLEILDLRSILMPADAPVVSEQNA